MNGDSKFLTLAALGVIGLGSAMPFWSAWSSTSQAPPEKTSPPTAAQENRYDVGQYWDQQVSRPDVVTLTPRSDSQTGLDNPAQIPTLSVGNEFAQPVPAQPILADVPINQVGSVSLASREEAIGATPRYDRGVTPISTPGATERLAPTVTSPVITTRQTLKPALPQASPSQNSLPETQVQQQFTPLPRIAPPNHGASNRGASETRQHRVRDGDSLESIAEKYLGDPLLADVIFQANRGQLDSPDLLPIGAKLVIPNADLAGAQSEGPQPRPLTRLKPVSPGKWQSETSDRPWTPMAPPGA